MPRPATSDAAHSVPSTAPHLDCPVLGMDGKVTSAPPTSGAPPHVADAPPPPPPSLRTGRSASYATVAAAAPNTGSEEKSQAAHNLLDDMPTRDDACVVFREITAQEVGKYDEEEPAEFGAGDEADRLSELPDTLLHHIISFLPVPVEDAMWTCVLGRRWRHIWKSATGLHIGEYEQTVTALRRFVDSFFILREDSPLRECELTISDFSEDGDMEHVDLWFRLAVECKARVVLLNANNDFIDPYLYVDNLPLVSKHLMRLELWAVQCHTRFLDFSSCTMLEHLEFQYCGFSFATKLSSESLKSLTMSDSEFPEELRLRIYAPNLVSLHLDGFLGRTPILESMPSLVDAFIEVNENCDDEVGAASLDFDVGKSGCVLLNCLSEAKRLTLISLPGML